MAESMKPFYLTMTKSGTSVRVNVSCNSQGFIWIKAITVSLRGAGNQQAWTFREGDPQQGFFQGRSGLLDPGSGGALFVEVPNAGWAKEGSVTAWYVELSEREFGTFKWP